MTEAVLALLALAGAAAAVAVAVVGAARRNDRERAGAELEALDRMHGRLKAEPYSGRHRR